MAEVGRMRIYRIDPNRGLQLGSLRLTGKQTEDSRIIDENQLTERIAYLLHKNEQEGLTTQEESDLTALKLEQEDRANRKAGTEQNVLDEYLKDLGGAGGGSGSSAGGGLTPPSYTNELDMFLKGLQSDQEGLLARVFGSKRKAGTDEVNERYAAERKRAIEEAAATGNLSSPSARHSLNTVDAERNKSLDRMLNELTGQEATAALNQGNRIADLRLNNADRLTDLGFREKQLGVNTGLNERQMNLNALLRKAELISGARSGTRNYALNRDIFNEDRRKTAFGESEMIAARKMAEEIGRRQADNEGDDFLGTLTGVASGIGGLAGGIGGLAGGIGTFMNARKKKPTQTAGVSGYTFN